VRVKVKILVLFKVLVQLRSCLWAMVDFKIQVILKVQVKAMVQ